MWWYGAIRRGLRDQTQPKITVLFRRISDANELTDDYECRALNTTDLGWVRHGSVWRDGQLASICNHRKQRFRVNFSGDERNLRQLVEGPMDERSYLFPLSAYPILKARQGDLAGAWILHFRTDEGVILLVPCMLFFSRLYGHSEELRRVLLTYPWAEVEKRLFASPPPGMPAETDGRWTVCRPTGLFSGDDLLLAHLKYREQARRRTKWLYAQLESAGPKAPVFLKVVPWWDGPGDIEVSGIPIGSTRMFLALDIFGITTPRSKPIISQRPIGWPAEFTGDGEGMGSGSGVRTSSSPMLGQPDPIAIDENNQPGRNAPTLQILERELQWLGEPPAITEVRARETSPPRGGNRRGPPPGPPNNASAGEPHGSDKNVGAASIHAPIALESHGMLRDMWTALQTLASVNYEGCGGLAFYTRDGGLEAGPEPRLMPFGRTDVVSDKDAEDLKEKKKRKRARSWSDIRNDEGGPPRGALLARLGTDKGYVYFLEIERKAKPVLDTNGGETGNFAEEPFCGLTFKLADAASLQDWVGRMMDMLPTTRGVFRNELLQTCPGVAQTFKHVLPKESTSPWVHIAQRAIAKLGKSHAPRGNAVNNPALLAGHDVPH